MRVLIVGTSGSGKTTLARRLAAATGAPHIELDAINWQAGWRDLYAHDPALFAERVRDAAAGTSWVCDGNYGKVRPILIARASDVVVLDYARSVVMCRVVQRSFIRALVRKELWPGTGNREDFLKWLDPEHPIRWAWSTHARRRANHRAMLTDPAFAAIRFHHLTHPHEADALVEKLSQAQQSHC